MRRRGSVCDTGERVWGALCAPGLRVGREQGGKRADERWGRGRTYSQTDQHHTSISPPHIAVLSTVSYSHLDTK